MVVVTMRGRWTIKRKEKEKKRRRGRRRRRRRSKGPLEKRLGGPRGRLYIPVVDSETERKAMPIDYLVVAGV